MTTDRHGRVDGTDGGTDPALDRRGFTTWPLRLRAAVAVTVAAAVAAGAGAFLADNLSNTFGPDSVCEGAVSADALTGALGSGKAAGREYGDGHLPAGTAFCRATVSRGIFGNDRSVTVELRRTTDLSLLADDPTARLFAASANSGAAGAASDHRAWALLPEGCDNSTQVVVSSDGDEGPGARELAGLSVAVANRIATQRSCGTAPLPAPHDLSAPGAEHALDRNAVCGLPGFTLPDAPGSPALREAATTATDPLWTCRVDTAASPRSSVAFTIGTEPRLLAADAPTNDPGLGRARWVQRDEMMTTCQGRPVHFRLSWKGPQKLIPDSDEIWKQFLTAGGRAIGCEPIL
ncbi:hypothetical protein AB0O91_26370 [Kitasatospora sp. NPDC089797]|uniref:hypothetical protein n=1 Tax=Kitasatospora sp. NPDC089797 TaxID=3155298 RepID=UPI003417EB37